MTISNQFFPFGPSPGNNSQAYLVYDLQINKIDPGVVYVPTEPNGVYVATREVGGCYWIVLNADYNTDAATWQQVSPQNAATAAYAVEYCSDGNVYEWYSPATIIPGTAITWVQLSARSNLGNYVKTPVVATVSSQNVETLVQLWNMGTSAIANARRLNVTDTSSNTDSLVDNIQVNGTPVWQIRKDGTLVVGKISAGALVGPFIFPNLQVTGNTQLNTLTTSGLANFTGGEIVTGGLTTDSLHVTGNTTLDGNLGVGGNETVGGTLNVTGATTLSSLHTTGNATVDGNLAVGGNETVGGSLGVTGNITSGGTITAAAFSNPAGQLGSTSPAYVTASATAPIVGTSVTLTIASSYSFQVGQTVVVADSSNSVGFSGTVISGNGFPATQITVQAEFYYQGSAGTTLSTNTHVYTGSGVARITNTDNSLTITRTNNDLVINAGTVAPIVYGASFAVANTYAVGQTTGSLAFASALPGTSSTHYTIIVIMQMQLQNASHTFTLTGTGCTWPNSPQTYENSQAASFPGIMYGSAVGGQTPSVVWTTNDVLGYQPATMVMTAYVNA